MKNEKDEPVAAASATLPIVANSEQLAQLFAEHHRRVLVAAYRITGSMADAEDVAQAVFLRLANSDTALLKNAGSYLYRAAMNGALDLLRRRKIHAVEPLEAAAGVAYTGQGDSPEGELSSRQLGEWLRGAIATLPPRAAEMFTLRYMEELGNREIAILLGTSQAVVAVTLHNARSRLKKQLTEFERGKR